MKTYHDRMADVTARIRSKKRRRKALAISCLSLALVLVASWMLIPSGGKPGSNLEGTETTGGVLEHDYAQVAEKLSVLLHPNNGSSSGDHNTGSSAAVSGTTAGVMAPGAAPDDDYVYEGNPGGGASGGSVEVTDNQVQGVTEADLFKRTTEHIFYLRSGQISAYSIAGEDSALVGVYNIDLVSDEEYFGKLAFATRWEMYLSEDGNTLTVLAYVCYEESGAMVVAVGLDVSDVTNIQQINRVFLTGYYLSSRMVDDQLLLMTRYNISRNMNPEDPSTYVPSVGTPGNM